jgi:hypothetical protein
VCAGGEGAEKEHSTAASIDQNKEPCYKKNGCCVKEKADCKRKGPGVKEKGLV